MASKTETVTLAESAIATQSKLVEVLSELVALVFQGFANADVECLTVVRQTLILISGKDNSATDLRSFFDKSVEDNKNSALAGLTKIWGADGKAVETPQEKAAAFMLKLNGKVSK